MRTTPREHTLHASTHTQHTQRLIMDPLTPLVGVDSPPAASSTSTPPAAVSTASAAVPFSSGQSHIGKACPALSKWRPSLIDAPVCCALLCVGAPLVAAGSPRMDASGLNQLCELCSTRISRVKHHRAHGPGRACHPRCKTLKRSADDAPTSAQDDSSLATAAAAAAAAAAERPKKKTRRARSDPGEKEEVQTHTRLRARADAVKKKPPLQATRRNPPSLLSSSSSLDEIHARRLAFLASVAASSSSSSSSSARM